MGLALKADIPRGMFLALVLVVVSPHLAAADKDCFEQYAYINYRGADALEQADLLRISARQASKAAYQAHPDAGKADDSLALQAQDRAYNKIYDKACTLVKGQKEKKKVDTAALCTETWKSLFEGCADDACRTQIVSLAEDDCQESLREQRPDNTSSSDGRPILRY